MSLGSNFLLPFDCEGTMDKATILAHLSNNGITSLDQLADRAVAEAQKGGGHPQVKVADLSFLISG